MADSDKRAFQLEIITGMSGAGKSQVIHALEDLGYYCVDNLPPTLIPKFAELIDQSRGKINQVALVIDIRGGEFFPVLFDSLSQLGALGIKYEILFLEASDETLIRRFKETRRRHPLAPKGRVLEGISAERVRLEELRGMADKVIDPENPDIYFNQCEKELSLNKKIARKVNSKSSWFFCLPLKSFTKSMTWGVVVIDNEINMSLDVKKSRKIEEMINSISFLFERGNI